MDHEGVLVFNTNTVMNLATKEYVDNNGGETKAKTWLCTFLDKDGEVGCSFDWLDEIEQAAVDSYKTYDLYDAYKNAAIIKFKEAKSMVEVNNWLMHDFKCSNGDKITDYAFPRFRPIAVCVMSDNSDEWPEAN